MKKQFAKLPKAEREKVELEYHGMKPEDFDATMSRAKPYSPEAVRLSTRSSSKRKSKATEKKRAA
jgi:hypothetical protein